MKINFAAISHRPTPIRIGLFVLMLLVLWLPLKIPIDWAISVFYGVTDASQNLASIVTLVVLYLEFVGLVKFWGRFVYREPLFRAYGLRQPRQNLRNLLQGLAISFGSLFFMFGLEGVLGWVQWQTPSATFARIALEGGIMALAVGFAEELLFRGWLLNELDRGYSPNVSLCATGIIFALIHGIRPQFPALLILGMILVWGKRATQGRLGWSIGFHAGLVWSYYLVNVGQLVTITNRVPAWVTGIERNPLAGVVGILALSVIAIGVRSRALKARF